MSEKSKSVANQHRGRKVFGVGLPRTGTTSLSAALNALGLPTKHVICNQELFSEFVGFTDTPIWCDYKLLDSKFPNSCFILLKRDVESWLDSFENTRMKASFNSDMERRRKGISPSPEGIMNQRCFYQIFQAEVYEREVFRRAFLRHEEEVGAYFSGRNDFLSMELGDPESWPKLVEFLRSKFELSFPHRNKRNRSAKVDE